MADISTDYDSPWKEALEHFFEDFVSLLAPDLHTLIDWSVAPVFLDKELQSLVTASPNGRRHADKLIKVRRRGQGEAWVLVHVRVESGARGGKALARLAQRMFTYFYRIWDSHVCVQTGAGSRATSVALEAANTSFYGLAILTSSQGGPPQLVHRQCLGKCHVRFCFPVVHLRRWEVDTAALIDTAALNPFAMVVMAQLSAQSHGSAQARLASKTQLVRLLYQHCYPRRQIQQLFRLIDWVLALPQDLEPAFEQAIYAIEREFNMSYVTSIERLGEARGLEKGLYKGLQAGLRKGMRAGVQQGLKKGLKQGSRDGAAWMLLLQLERRFGEPPAWVVDRIARADVTTLKGWAIKILDANSIETVFE